MKKELTFKAFYACLEQQKNFNRPVLFESIDFPEDLEVRFEHRDCSLTFIDCAFNGRFESRNLTSSTELLFNDCQVKGDLFFSSSGSPVDCKISLISTKVEG